MSWIWVVKDLGGKSNDPYAYVWWIWLVNLKLFILLDLPFTREVPLAPGNPSGWWHCGGWAAMPAGCDWLLGWLPGVAWRWHMFVIGIETNNQCRWMLDLKWSYPACHWRNPEYHDMAAVLCFWHLHPIPNVTSLVACIHAHQQSFCFYLGAYDCWFRHTTMTDLYWFLQYMWKSVPRCLTEQTDCLPKTMS